MLALRAVCRAIVERHRARTTAARARTEAGTEGPQVAEGRPAVLPIICSRPRAASSESAGSAVPERTKLLYRTRIKRTTRQGASYNTCLHSICVLSAHGL
jgi:hypothetical protein